MDIHLNRREWLKTSAAAVAGWIAGSGSTAARAGSVFRPGSEGEAIRLLYNESHFGISEAARKAIFGALGDCSVYPDDHYDELKELIAARENLERENVILGAGSIEIITAALQVYMSRGGVLTSDPTYFDFVDYAARTRCALRQVPLTDRYGLDLEAMEKRAGSHTAMVYLCNPQNPTGVITPQAQLRPFCRKASKKALVVLDEAYCDYVEDPAYSSMVDLVREGDNILVTRTFSKVHGLAGLRVGYGLARPDIIKNLLQLERNFAPVSILSLRAAIASYEDREFVAKVRRQNNEVKSYICGELGRLGYNFIPTHTNFVIFKIRQDSRELAKEMEGRSVLVQPLRFLDSDWIRVSLGTLPEMRTFMAHLEDLSVSDQQTVTTRPSWLTSNSKNRARVFGGL
jgi:histidinol-phosphate aminotransferase